MRIPLDGLLSFLKQGGAGLRQSQTLKTAAQSEAHQYGCGKRLPQIGIFLDEPIDPAVSPGA
jgi:hypothetical protein